MYIFLIGVVVPIVVLRTRERTVALAWVPMRERWVAMLVPQLILGLSAVGVAYRERIDLRVGGTVSSVGWLSGPSFVLVATLVMWRYWRQSVIDRDQVIRLFTPRDAYEKRVWVLLSAAAGIAEELVWRATFVTLVARVTGSLALATIVSVLSFGLAHTTQGLRSAAAIAGFALAFHGIVAFSGSLLPAMLAHFLYDAVAGLSYDRLTRELGYFEDAVAEPS